MKVIKYLSPSSITQWLTDQREFYLKYLADNRPDKIPQTIAMSVGSAFDAYCKAHLMSCLYGAHNNPKFDFETLFEAQVEPQNRDYARQAGLVCFTAYKNSGALADMLTMLHGTDARFEFEVRGEVENEIIGDVVFLGKPDAAFKKGDTHVILDWKVNGYASKWGVSPTAGYVKIRDSWSDGKPSRNNNCAHKDAQVMVVEGMEINVAQPMEKIDEVWARQLSIYSWLCGYPVGEKIIVAIDQLACKDGKIRVAEFRNYVSPEFQQNLYGLCQEIWEIVHSDHIFRDMSKEDSQARCQVLDGMAEGLKGDTDLDLWFKGAVRGS